MSDKILYNVTVKINQDAHEEWLKWMISVHIPDVMATQLFESHKMSQILGDQHSDGLTYAIQYVSFGMKEFEQYQSQYASKLQKDHSERYNGKYVAFRTLMRIVDES